MNTFLPTQDFAESAAALATKRLGKQRLEALTLLRTLLGRSAAFGDHPVAALWRGHEPALARYGLIMATEWRRRGLADSALPQIAELAHQLVGYGRAIVDPPWVGDERVHASHRAALLAEDTDHYRALGWVELPSEELFWPTPPAAAVVEVSSCPVCSRELRGGVESSIFKARVHAECVDRFCDWARSVGVKKPDDIAALGVALVNKRSKEATNG